VPFFGGVQPGIDPLESAPCESAANPRDEKWWIRGPHASRYHTALCMCVSCRTSSGFDVQPWAFVPRANLHVDSGSGGGSRPLEMEEGAPGMKTAKRYASSEGIERWFCGGCGASLFFVDESRSELVDVSVGLMRAKSGSRAEEWLEWGPNVSGVDEAQCQELGNLLMDGIRQARKTSDSKAVGQEE
jgi:hypothetical protein